MKRCEKWLKTQGEFQIKLRSLPSWERGLKFLRKNVKDERVVVAPLVGAWIEICQVLQHLCRFIVAPLVGAWIEIPVKFPTTAKFPRSLPSWERGLKYAYEDGALEKISRSPRGSVD